jgi:hypothetical protein
LHIKVKIRQHPKVKIKKKVEGFRKLNIAGIYSFVSLEKCADFNMEVGSHRGNSQRENTNKRHRNSSESCLGQ